MKATSQLCVRFFLNILDLRRVYLEVPLLKRKVNFEEIAYSENLALCQPLNIIVSIYMEETRYLETMRKMNPDLKDKYDKIIDFVKTKFPDRLKIEIIRDNVTQRMFFNTYIIHEETELQITGFRGIGRIEIEKFFGDAENVNAFLKDFQEICENHFNFVRYEYREESALINKNLVVSEVQDADKELTSCSAIYS